MLIREKSKYDSYRRQQTPRTESMNARKQMCKHTHTPHFNSLGGIGSEGERMSAETMFFSLLTPFLSTSHLELVIVGRRRCG